MSKVKIADIVIDISCADEAFFEQRLREYLYDGPVQPEMVIRSFWEDPVTLPSEGTAQTIRENLWLVTCPNGILCRYTVHPETQKVLQAVYFNRDHTLAEIRLSASRKNAFFSLTDYEYMLTGAAFSDRVARLGGVVMHGSSLAYGGEGVIFTANSGKGKSTHTGLWRERFADAVTIVNDDKPAIRFYDGRPVMFGTPWSGSTALNRNISVPLKAIVVIEQAPENALRPLTVPEALYHLTGQTVRPYYDSENGVRTLDAVARLVETVPCYLLQCTVSQEAVSLVHDTLYGKDS